MQQKPNLIAPGSTVTSAAAMALDTVKVRESTILTLPPLSWVGCILEKEKVNGVSTKPWGLLGSAESSVGGATNDVRKISIIGGFATYCWGKCKVLQLVCVQMQRCCCSVMIVRNSFPSLRCLLTFGSSSRVLLIDGKNRFPTKKEALTFNWNMGQPVRQLGSNSVSKRLYVSHYQRYQECGIFTEVALIEDLFKANHCKYLSFTHIIESADQNKFGTFGVVCCCLKGVRDTGWEVPEITGRLWKGCQLMMIWMWTPSIPE